MGVQKWDSRCGSLVRGRLLRFIFLSKMLIATLKIFINIIFKDLKVRKSQKQFFLKLH